MLQDTMFREKHKPYGREKFHNVDNKKTVTTDVRTCVQVLLFPG